MSTAQFPSLPGLGWSINRTSNFKNRKQVAISGKETVLADWQYPRYQWDLTFNLLRQGGYQAGTWAEFATLIGFYNARNGGFDSFLYQDQDDNQVYAQQIGVGDGTTALFQLCRTFGGYTEPLLAVTGSGSSTYGPNVYLNGTTSSIGWDYCKWGNTDVNGNPVTTYSPGEIWFATAPSAGTVITVDAAYSFPCRFVADLCEFEKFQTNCYGVKKLSFMSIK